MLVLVTGGAGFIGSHIIERLLGSHEVICLDNFDAYYNVEFKKKTLSLSWLMRISSWWKEASLIKACLEN